MKMAEMTMMMLLSSDHDDETDDDDGGGWYHEIVCVCHISYILCCVSCIYLGSGRREGVRE